MRGLGEMAVSGARFPAPGFRRPVLVAVQCDISKGKAAAVTQHHRKKDTAQIKRDALKTPLFTL